MGSTGLGVGDRVLQREPQRAIDVPWVFCLEGDDAAAVATVALCLVEGFVGTRKDTDGVVGGEGFGDPDAQGQGLGPRGDTEVVDGLIETLCNGEGHRAWGLRQDEEELVAAVAAEIVASAQVGGDRFGDNAQCRVTRRMVRLIRPPSASKVEVLG